MARSRAEAAAWALLVIQGVQGFTPADTESEGYVGLVGGLLLLFAIIYALIHIFSWTLIRYRSPIDLVLLVFAARGLWPLFSVVRMRGRPQLSTA